MGCISYDIQHGTVKSIGADPNANGIKWASVTSNQNGSVTAVVFEMQSFDRKGGVEATHTWGNVIATIAGGLLGTAVAPGPGTAPFVVGGVPPYNGKGFYRDGYVTMHALTSNECNLIFTRTRATYGE